MYLCNAVQVGSDDSCGKDKADIVTCSVHVKLTSLEMNHCIETLVGAFVDILMQARYNVYCTLYDTFIIYGPEFGFHNSTPALPRSCCAVPFLGHLKLICEFVGHLTGLGGVGWLKPPERTDLRNSVEQYKRLTNTCLLNAFKHCSTALSYFAILLFSLSQLVI